MSAAWRYRAATPAGEVVDGVVHAESERAALDELRRRTLVPVALAADGGGSRLGRGAVTGVAKADAVAASMHAVAALLGGGASVGRSLDYATQHAGHPRVAQAWARVRDDVQGGQPLSAAMRGSADVFGTLAPAMVRAGEESGALDAALARLAEHLDRARQLREELRAALLYPALLAAVAGIAVCVLLTFVVPRFVGMLSDAGSALPASTRILVGASHLLTGWWWLWLGLAGSAGVGLRWWMSHATNRERWHAARLTWPVCGALETATWTARFMHTLGALLQAGSPVLASLRIAREGVENVALAGRMDAAIGRVERGDRIAVAFDGVLPPLGVQLLGVGEESGTLAAMAARVAESSDAEVQRGLRTLVGLVEPALIVLFGGLVGFVALAMLQAIYSINASVL